MLTPESQVCEGGANSIDRPDAKRLRDVSWGLGWVLRQRRAVFVWHWGDEGDSEAYIVAFDRTKLRILCFHE